MLEAPEFVWVLADSFDPRNGVALAKIVYDETGAAWFDDTFRPHTSRPYARPAIASGRTQPGGTPWKLWSETVTVPGKGLTSVDIGIETWVDTSGAGFAETPAYFANLQRTQVGTFLPLPLTHIDDAAPDGFLFRVFFPSVRLGEHTVNTARTTVASFDAEDHTLVDVDDASGFRIGDMVTKTGEQWTDVSLADVDTAKKRLTLSRAVESLKIGDQLRTAFVDLGGKAPTIGLDAVDDLAPGMQVLLSGKDYLRGWSVSPVLTVDRVETEAGTVQFQPYFYSIGIDLDPKRPPTQLTLINQGFATRFFRQVRTLGWSVAWIGCPGEMASPLDCPAACAVTQKEEF
jgi:hypothetical protein